MLAYKLKKELLRPLNQLLYFCPEIFPRVAKSALIKIWNCRYRLSYGYSTLNYIPIKPAENVRTLDISGTSDFAELIHPDVLYIPGGLGSENRQYVMTGTNFPDNNDYYESPEFLVSSNGTEWHVPDGGISPLIERPTDWVGYNSDPSLLYELGVVYLLYRKVHVHYRHTSVSLLLLSSKDGIKWTSPCVVIEKNCQKDKIAVLMSPSLLKLGDSYVMWYVEEDEKSGKYSIFRMESSDLKTWNSAKKISLINFGTGTEPWHIDVVSARDGSLVMVLCYFNKSKKNVKNIVFAVSNDAGYTWSVGKKHFKPDKYAFGGISLYRGALVENPDGNWLLFYSWETCDKHWVPAVMNFTADELSDMFLT